MNIEKNEIIFNKSYYNKAAFNNVYLSSIIALNDYLVSVYFPDEPTRLIYASNDFAFRRRQMLQNSDEEDSSKFQVNSLNMPFMSFSVSSGGISADTERMLKNNQLEKTGIMDWTIKKKIRLSPVKIDFEATYFSTEEIDIQYVMSLLQWDGASETLIKPEIEIDGHTFCNYGSLDITSINYRPTYNENDWLEKNKIRTISMSFALDTYLILIDDSSFWIPKTVLLSFATSKGIEIEDIDNYDVLLSGILDHVNEKVTF